MGSVVCEEIVTESEYALSAAIAPTEEERRTEGPLGN